MANMQVIILVREATSILILLLNAKCIFSLLGSKNAFVLSHTIYDLEDIFGIGTNFLISVFFFFENFILELFCFILSCTIYPCFDYLDEHWIFLYYLFGGFGLFSSIILSITNVFWSVDSEVDFIDNFLCGVDALETFFCFFSSLNLAKPPALSLLFENPVKYFMGDSTYDLRYYV